MVRKATRVTQEEVVITPNTTVEIDGETVNVSSIKNLQESFMATCADVAAEYPGWCISVSWLYAAMLGAVLGYIINLLATMLALGVVVITGSIVAGGVVYYGVLAAGLGYLVYDLVTGGKLCKQLNDISTAAGITTVGGLVHLKRKLFAKREVLVTKEA